MVRRRRFRGMGRGLPWFGLWLSSMPAPAFAHATERGIILLLPTDLYIGGGAAVVALTFALMAAVPAAGLDALKRARFALGSVPAWNPVAPSAAMLVVVAALVAAGWWGNRDPLSNPLPLMLWTVWWVALTFLHAVFGNLWAVLHPWLALYRLLTVPPFLRRWRRAPPLSYPRAAGYWPAVVLFLAFAWFELVYPAPQDPALLAYAVTAYFLITAAGALLFGLDAWLRHGEIFSIFFRIVSWLSPFGVDREGERRTVFATVPGMRLLDAGCGPGSVTCGLAEAVAPAAVTGIDLSADVLEQARALAAERGVDNASFETGDVYALEYADESFDVVFANQLLQHLTDPPAALREFRRVLRPGGLVAVRDADYATMSPQPHFAEFDDWNRLYHQVARRNAAEPDAGRHLPDWLRAAGFPEYELHPNVVLLEGGDARIWGEAWSQRILHSGIAEQALEYGLADQAELERLSQGWLHWSEAEHPLYLFAQVAATAVK